MPRAIVFLLLLALLLGFAQLAAGLNYAYFTDYEVTRLGQRSKFWYGDTMSGPVRSNDTIAIMQDPVFNDFVITSAPDFWRGSGYNPQINFYAIFNAPRLEIPQRADTIRAWAVQQGHFFATNDSTQARLVLGDHNLRIWWYARADTTYDSLNYVDYPLPDSAVAFFQCPIVRLSGVVHSILIFGCAGMIGLEDNVLYASSNPVTGAVAPHHPEKLALVSENDIKILNTVANGRANSGYPCGESGLAQTNPARTSIAINGLLFALNESFTFEQQNDLDSGYVYECGPDDRGTIYLTGMIAQWRRGYVHRATLNSTGYLKFYANDRDLKFWNPGIFNARENEVVPSVISFGDVRLDSSAVETLRVVNDYVPIRLDSQRVIAPFAVADTAHADSFQWTQTITVHFQPTAFGEFRDTLHLKSNYYDLWLHVPLSGRCLDLAAGPSSILHPSSFSLSAFPNPFNSRTQIVFSLPEAGAAALRVYDMQGRQVADLAHSRLERGEHHINFDAGALPSGLYFARLTSPGGNLTHKLLLVK